MLTAGQLTDQPAALAGRQLRVDHVLDQLIPEQRGPPGPLSPAALLFLSLAHFPLPSNAGVLIVRTEEWPPTALAHQGQLVLAASTLMPGAGKAPRVTAEASSHGDNPDAAGPQRRAAAPAAATIAATASARSDPAGAGGSGSGSSPHNKAVNAERNGSARATARRSQPRTVAAGRPSRSAIF